MGLAILALHNLLHAIQKVNLFNFSNSSHLQNVNLKQNQTQSTGVLLTRFVQRISAHSMAFTKLATRDFLHSAWTNWVLHISDRYTV